MRPHEAEGSRLSSDKGGSLHAENDTLNRIWPAKGIWGASYRIMFPLTAIWAIVSVTIWVGKIGSLDVPDPITWHLHEMIVGLGSGALLGYLPSAISSWTGRAPVSGAPVKVMVFLWIATRMSMYLANDVPEWSIAALNLAVFWVCAFVLIGEAIRGASAKIWAYIAFLLVAGGAAAVSSLPGQGNPLHVTLLFGGLLWIVGTRMAFGFLQSQAIRNGQTTKPDQRWLTWCAVCAPMLLPLAQYCHIDGPTLHKAIIAFSAFCLSAQCARWPLKWARGQGLTAMTCVGVFWIPVGLWIGALELFNQSAISMSALRHAPIMGALSSLTMAVMARPYARRTVCGLQANVGIYCAFVALQIAVISRLFDAVTMSYWFWILAWLVFLFAIWPNWRAPIPRPIFSGSRRKRTH